jgi:hypothetical protein
MSERDQRLVLKWLKRQAVERNIPYVDLLEWWFVHRKPSLGQGAEFNEWMDNYHKRTKS